MSYKAQARVKNGMIHVQVKSDICFNRSYGAAFDVEAEKDLLTELASFPHTEPSLAGTDPRYVKIDLQVEDDALHGILPNGEMFKITNDPEVLKWADSIGVPGTSKKTEALEIEEIVEEANKIEVTEKEEAKLKLPIEIIVSLKIGSQTLVKKAVVG